jgi:hypothetical protein
MSTLLKKKKKKEEKETSLKLWFGQAADNTARLVSLLYYEIARP